MSLADVWDDVLITHQAAVNRLPASIREDFQPPSPFDALRACGISFADLTMPRAEFSEGGVVTHG